MCVCACVCACMIRLRMCNRVCACIHARVYVLICIYLDICVYVWMHVHVHVHVPCGVYQMWDRYTTQLVDELRMTIAWKQRKVREGVLLMCMCVYVYKCMQVIVKTLCSRGGAYLSIWIPHL